MTELSREDHSLHAVVHSLTLADFEEQLELGGVDLHQLDDAIARLREALLTDADASWKLFEATALAAAAVAREVGDRGRQAGCDQ